jgi:hypothetical protein
VRFRRNGLPPDGKLILINKALTFTLPVAEFSVTNRTFISGALRG